jgi:hypothetical protein
MTASLAIKHCELSLMVLLELATQSQWLEDVMESVLL